MKNKNEGKRFWKRKFWNWIGRLSIAFEAFLEILDFLDRLLVISLNIYIDALLLALASVSIIIKTASIIIKTISRLRKDSWKLLKQGLFKVRKFIWLFLFRRKNGEEN